MLRCLWKAFSHFAYRLLVTCVNTTCNCVSSNNLAFEIKTNFVVNLKRCGYAQDRRQRFVAYLLQRARSSSIGSADYVRYMIRHSIFAAIVSGYLRQCFARFDLTVLIPDPWSYFRIKYRN
jgi:hypothetical protein